jgi:hypothetical protein
MPVDKIFQYKVIVNDINVDEMPVGKMSLYKNYCLYA